MTDIIKDFEQRVSGKLMSYLAANPDFEKQQIASLRQEFLDLGVSQLTIVAFGNDAERIARRPLSLQYKIVGIPHYAKFILSGNYRAAVSETLAEIH